MEVLSVNNLNKSFGSFKLENVSFNVKQGKIVGFIGINGAGKTTTIKLLLDLINKSSGDITYFGERFVKENENNIKKRIGVVLDGSFFYESLTMKEMKSIVAASYSNWNEDKYNSYMNKFGLDENQKIGSLSKGMKMKYALALALSHEAELLIMDEPAGGLDPLVRNQLDDILLDYVSDGKHSVFFSTHITSDLDKIADEVVFINEGKVVLQKTKEELIKNYSNDEKMPTIEEIMINYIRGNEAC